MLFKKSWKHKVTRVEGNCILFGVNIFDYEWNDTGEIVTVTDPQYRQKHNFNVYAVDIDGTTKKFAAGEFGNCIWGFYLEE